MLPAYDIVLNRKKPFVVNLRQYPAFISGKGKELRKKKLSFIQCPDEDSKLTSPE